MGIYLLLWSFWVSERHWLSIPDFFVIGNLLQNWQKHVSAAYTLVM